MSCLLVKITYSYKLWRQTNKQKKPLRFDVRTVHLVQFIIQSNKCTTYTGCPRRKGPNFGRVFLRSNYTDITQNTYIQSSMVTEILAREV